MQPETISIETDDRGVATLTLNRPDKHNVLGAEMIAELHAAAEMLPNSGARVVVLTGAGRSFCAGGDLGWMKAQIDADRAQRMEEARKLARMLKALYELPLPLIGRINGQAYGGGIGMISVCDAAVVADGAKFGLTETRLGLIPATIAPYVVQKMTPPKAREVFASTRIFDGAEAVRLGLLSATVPAEDLDSAIEAQVAPYLSTAPGAVAEAKALVRSLATPLDEATIEATIKALADRWESPESRDGIDAFFAKRPPPWAPSGT